MNSGMHRRLERLERDGGAGVPDLVALLDASRAEEVEARRTGLIDAVVARRAERSRLVLTQLDADAGTRRLTRLEGRLQDALRRMVGHS